MKQIRWLMEQIQYLMAEKFYGQITIRFEAGNITVIKKEQSLIPPK